MVCIKWLQIRKINLYMYFYMDFQTSAGNIKNGKFGLDVIESGR